MAVPSFGQIEQFCNIDGWRRLAPTDHQPFVKIVECPGQKPRALHTQVSHNRGHSPSQNQWGFMLRAQLEVTDAQFWEALNSGKPATRECPPALAPVTELPAWLVYQLEKYHVTGEELNGMSKEDALARLAEERMKPR